MIIKGRRRGGARALANHLLKTDTNEVIAVREIELMIASELNPQAMRIALRQMETFGRARGKDRVLYHGIMALQQGEILDSRQFKRATETYARNLGLTGHKRLVVEHRKAGRQHFHIVFDLLHPVTGKQARLSWSKKIEWNTSRQLERMFNLRPVVSKGKPARRWECERGKRSGVDPVDMRKAVTAIYKRATNAKEFIHLLANAGLILAVGRNGSFVLLDKAGDVHGLMRRIEGAKLKDLRTKFKDLKTSELPTATDVQNHLRGATPISPSASYRGKKGATAQRRQISPLDAKSAPFSKAVSSIRSRLGQVSSDAAAYARKAGLLLTRRKKKDENEASVLLPNREEVERAELLAYAWDNGRIDILRLYGFTFPEPDDP